METGKMKQKAFNHIEKRITELKDAQKTTEKGMDYWTIKDAIKALEIKLAEIAMELTAERHETQY